MKTDPIHQCDEKITGQYVYIDKLSQILSAKAVSKGVKLKAFTDTYGCQQNVADTQKLAGFLLEMGYEICSDAKEADFIVINSCAVREHAELKILSNIGNLKHLKANNPELIIAICGCMVQQEHMAEKIKSSYPFVDMVFGTHIAWKFPELLYNCMTSKKRIFDISQDDDNSIAEGIPIMRESETKAFVSIMYGCNNFCTYCIVPHVRGRERSRYPDKIYQEVKTLVEDGCSDITLLGQNVNSYGKDLDIDMDFADLLAKLNEISGEFLIRFMTSHPKDASHKLFDIMASSEKVAKQLHLPFQSGSDRILKMMNRHYNSSEYRELISYARKKMPDLILTSDVMVGFPTEDDDDFEETMKLVTDLQFDTLFTFIYSKRSGTPAATYEDPISKEQKQKNFERLVETQNRIVLQKHNDMVSKIYEVTIEGKSRNDEFPIAARTRGGVLVLLAQSEHDVGSRVKAKILSGSMRSVIGEII